MQQVVNKNFKVTVPDNLSDDNLGQFYGKLNLLIDKKPREIDIDCSLLERATSTHINILWDVRYSCNEAGITMRLVSVSESLKRVLKVLDLYDLLVGQDNRNAASQERRIIPEIDTDNNIFEMEFKATDSDIRSNAKRFKEYLGLFNLDEISILELETIFYEVTMNIYLHAQTNKQDLIRLNISMLSDKIGLKFIYSGVQFDPAERVRDYDPGAVIKQRQKRGYGLIMINRMADKISYKRTKKDLNELYIEKYWGGSHV